MSQYSFDVHSISYHKQNKMQFLSISQDSLLLSNMKNFLTNYSDTIQITFSSTLCFESIILEKAYLTLPIMDIPYLSNHNHMLMLSCCFLSASNAPAGHSMTYYYPVNQSTLASNILCLNITPLFQQWMISHLPTCRITLAVHTPGILIRFEHRETAKPVVHIEYESKLPPPPEHRTPLLYLNSMKHCSEIVDSQAPILFDQNDPEYSYKISYSSDTGFFTFELPGYYHIQWILNLLGCSDCSDICIGLKDITANTVTKFYSPIIIPEQITGQFVIHVTDISHQYALVNLSSDRIQLSEVETQSSLTIFQI